MCWRGFGNPSSSGKEPKLFPDQDWEGEERMGDKSRFWLLSEEEEEEAEVMAVKTNAFSCCQSLLINYHQLIIIIIEAIPGLGLLSQQ